MELRKNGIDWLHYGFGGVNSNPAFEHSNQLMNYRPPLLDEGDAWSSYVLGPTHKKAPSAVGQKETKKETGRYILTWEP